MGSTTDGGGGTAKVFFSLAGDVTPEERSKGENITSLCVPWQEWPVGSLRVPAGVVGNVKATIFRMVVRKGRSVASPEDGGREEARDLQHVMSFCRAGN